MAGLVQNHGPVTVTTVAVAVTNAGGGSGGGVSGSLAVGGGGSANGTNLNISPASATHNNGGSAGGNGGSGAQASTSILTTATTTSTLLQRGGLGPPLASASSAKLECASSPGNSHQHPHQPHTPTLMSTTVASSISPALSGQATTNNLASANSQSRSRNGNVNTTANATSLTSTVTTTTGRSLVNSLVAGRQGGAGSAGDQHLPVTAYAQKQPQHSQPSQPQQSSVGVARSVVHDSRLHREHGPPRGAAEHNESEGDHGAEMVVDADDEPQLQEENDLEQGHGQVQEPEIDVVINNVVCSFSVGCHLNLRQIALTGANVEFRRESGMVSMKLRNPYTTASIWSSGKITCTGATSEMTSKMAARKYARVLQKLGFRARFKNFKIVNVLGTCTMPFAIKLVPFSQANKTLAQYEPELHPGVTYKIREIKATLKIFSTGSITVTAPSVSAVQQSIERIYPLVFEHRKERTCPEDMPRSHHLLGVAGAAAAGAKPGKHRPSARVIRSSYSASSCEAIYERRENDGEDSEEDQGVDDGEAFDGGDVDGCESDQSWG